MQETQMQRRNDRGSREFEHSSLLVSRADSIHIVTGTTTKCTKMCRFLS